MDEKEQAVVSLLQQYRRTSRKIHIAPEIPEGKLHNARKVCQIPDEETVTALFDLTEWGSAKHCLVLCPQTLYYNCGAPAKLTLAEFLELPITSGWGAFKIGDRPISSSTDSLPNHLIVQCLADIQLIHKKGPDVDLASEPDRPFQPNVPALTAVAIAGLAILIGGSYILTRCDDDWDATKIGAVCMILVGSWMLLSTVPALLRAAKRKKPADQEE